MNEFIYSSLLLRIFIIYIFSQHDTPDCYDDGETSLQAEPELRGLGAEGAAGNGRLCPCLPLPAPGEFGTLQPWAMLELKACQMSLIIDVCIFYGTICTTEKDTVEHQHSKHWKFCLFYRKQMRNWLWKCVAWSSPRGIRTDGAEKSKSWKSLSRFSYFVFFFLLPCHVALDLIWGKRRGEVFSRCSGVRPLWPVCGGTT